MLRNIRLNTAKKWLKFTAKQRSNKTADSDFCIIDLPKELIEDFVDFQMNNFVNKEITHRISGIHNSSEALKEYKDIIKKCWANPPYYSVVCCPERDDKILPKIVSSCTLKLLEKNKLGDIISAKTKELKRYFELERNWNNLYPVAKVMERYGVDKALEYHALTVDPDYNRIGIATEVGLIRHELCHSLDVHLCVGWMTAIGTQKAAAKNGWETAYELPADEIAKLLNVTFKTTTPTFKFMIYRL